MDNKKFALATKLESLDPSKLNMVIGFDGFIDAIIHAVDKRLDSTHFTRIERMTDFAKRIEKASGLSTNIELFPTQKKIGGNGPIMCNALSKHQANLTYIGALGYPSIHEVFTEMADFATLYTVADSGQTDALEFDDGKLMLGKMSSLNDVTYEKLIATVGFDHLITLLDQADLFAAVNWSMLPYMTDLWQKLLIHVCPHLKVRTKKPIFFVDLADPEKREHDEIIKALDLLKSFNGHFDVVLGLNKKEAYDIANVLTLFDSESLTNMQISLKDLNHALYQYLNIHAVVIHPVDRSSTVIHQQSYEEVGPYAAKPKLTTGAGDNFNSGFVLGLLLGLTPEESLLTGMATSGYYVRNAKSPDFKSLIQFLKDWANDNV
jgi:hypothetical protein